VDNDTLSETDLVSSYLPGDSPAALNPSMSTGGSSYTPPSGCGGSNCYVPEPESGEPEEPAPVDEPVQEEAAPVEEVAPEDAPAPEEVEPVEELPPDLLLPEVIETPIPE
jgi:hypothetical protein